MFKPRLVIKQTTLAYLGEENCETVHGLEMEETVQLNSNNYTGLCILTCRISFLHLGGSMKRDLSLYVGLVYKAANTQGQQAAPVKIQAVDMSEVCQRKLNVLLLNT